jgi:hypothetical protein
MLVPNQRLDAAHSGVTALAQGRKRRATGRARQAQRSTDQTKNGTRDSDRGWRLASGECDTVHEAAWTLPRLGLEAPRQLPRALPRAAHGPSQGKGFFSRC